MLALFADYRHKARREDLQITRTAVEVNAKPNRVPRWDEASGVREVRFQMQLARDLFTRAFPVGHTIPCRGCTCQAQYIDPLLPMKYG